MTDKEMALQIGARLIKSQFRVAALSAEAESASLWREKRFLGGGMLGIHFNVHYPMIFNRESTRFIVNLTKPVRKICFVLYIAQSNCSAVLSRHGILYRQPSKVSQLLGERAA